MYACYSVDTGECYRSASLIFMQLPQALFSMREADFQVVSIKNSDICICQYV